MPQAGYCQHAVSGTNRPDFCVQRSPLSLLCKSTVVRSDQAPSAKCWPGKAAPSRKAGAHVRHLSYVSSVIPCSDGCCRTDDEWSGLRLGPVSHDMSVSDSWWATHPLRPAASTTCRCLQYSTMYNVQHTPVTHRVSPGRQMAPPLLLQEGVCWITTWWNGLLAYALKEWRKDSL